MPFPSKVGKLTFSGVHAGGEEIWSFSLHTNNTSSAGIDFAGIKSAATAYINDSQVGVSASCELNQIKFAVLTTDGHYDGNAYPIITEVNPGVDGGVSGNYLPQASVCISLTTDQKRGLAHRGRFFLPPTGWQADVSNGRMFGKQVPLGIKTTTFLHALNTALGGGFHIVVASSRGAGAINNVTGFRIGDIIDTQRRRRNGLKEIYVDSNL